jgi:hypothetical protein
MKKILYGALAICLLSPALSIAAGADYDTLSEMAAEITASDFIPIFDASEADGSRMKKLSFDGTVTNCLTGLGTFAAFVGAEADPTVDTSAEIQAIIGAGVYDASGAAAAIIAASVTESDTTHCPDGASVFTALAGKQTSGSYLTEEVDPGLATAGDAELGLTGGDTLTNISGNVATDTINEFLADINIAVGALGGGVDFTAYDDVTWGAAAGGSQTHTFDTGAGTDPTMAISDDAFTYNKGIVALSFITSGANGTHFIAALNTAALSSSATDGNLAFLTDRYYLGDGTDYNDYLISKELIDTEAEFESAFFAVLVPGEIDDTPSDGNTTQPASSNSVFDGLALKADTGHTVQYSQTPTIADPDTWTMSGNGMYGGQWIGTAAGVGALPAIAAGMNFTAKARGAYAVTLEPNGTELIWLNGSSCGAGVNIVSDGTTGASAVCFFSQAGEWDCDGYLFACGS